VDWGSDGDGGVVGVVVAGSLEEEVDCSGMLSRRAFARSLSFWTSSFNAFLLSLSLSLEEEDMDRSSGDLGGIIIGDCTDVTKDDNDDHDDDDDDRIW